MTEDETIELARQAGVEDSNEYDHLVCTEVELIAFAKLVRNHYSYTHAHLWLTRIEGAVKAEREAIWNILFEYAGRDDLTPEDESLLKHLADLIKARGQL